MSASRAFATPARLLSLAMTLVLIGGCETLGLSSSEDYKDTRPTDNVRRGTVDYSQGSVLSNKGGFTLFGGGDEPGSRVENTGLGVNGYLWRASLDTISFMPIASADPFGGVITTDWFSPAGNGDDRVKLNVFILDRDLRADGVKVSVFRQSRDRSGNWIDAAPAPATASQLEETILTRARQLRMAQRDNH